MTDYIAKLAKLYADEVYWRSIGGTVEDLVDGGYDITIKPQKVISKEPLVNIEAFGADPNGILDSTSAIQSAIDYAVTEQVAGILIPSGTYLCASPIELKANVSVYGLSWNRSIIDYRGSSYTFYADEAIKWERYVGFKITHENNPTEGNVDFMVLKSGSDQSLFDLYFHGSKNNSRHGLVIHGKNPDTLIANQNSYGNRINIFARSDANTEVTGTAIYLYGEDLGNARCNGNIISGWIQHWSKAIFINGNGNWINGMVFNGKHSDKALHIEGDQAFLNHVSGCYFDGTITGDTIYLKNTSGNPMVYMVKLNGNVGINDPANDIVDGTGGSPYANYWMDDYRGTTYPRTGSLEDDPSNINWVGIRGQNSEGIFGIAGSLNSGAGRMVASGSAFSSGATYVSDNGGISVIFQDDSSAEFRVVKYNAGTDTYTRLFTIDNKGSITQLETTNGPIGYATMTSGTKTLTVNNTAVTAGSQVWLFPADKVAGQIFGSSQHLTVQNRVVGTSFDVVTADNTNVAADCNFRYLMLN